MSFIREKCMYCGKSIMIGQEILKSEKFQTIQLGNNRKGPYICKKCRSKQYAND